MSNQRLGRHEPAGILVVGPAANIALAAGTHYRSAALDVSPYTGGGAIGWWTNIDGLSSTGKISGSINWQSSHLSSTQYIYITGSSFQNYDINTWTNSSGLVGNKVSAYLSASASNKVSVTIQAIEIGVG
jgi:hypothetical protein